MMRACAMRDIGQLLNLLKHVKPAGSNQWTADCPCSNHKTPAKHLSIGLKDDIILLTCFGSHTAEDITKALGLELSDLFIKPEEKPAATAVKEKIVAEYDYKDEDGNLLFQVVRFDPKNFKQRYRNGNNEWVWNLEGVRRVPYHLPEILLHDGTIYLVEGEKDADNLWMWGQVATTSPGGASNWRDEYARYFIGKQVVIIPDKDNPGMAYARQVANSLIGKVQSLKVVLLLDGSKDVSEWLDKGSDIALLPTLEQDIETLFASARPVYRQLDDAIQWDKQVDGLLLSFRAEKISDERTGVHARITINAQHETLSWSYLNIERREDRSSLSSAAFGILKTDTKYSKDDLRHDLDAFCSGLWEYHVSRFVPEDLAGNETPEPLSFTLKPYILDNAGTIIFAAPGRGKSYTAQLWAQSIDAGCSKLWEVRKRKVLFINLERSQESVRRRLSMVNKVLGLSPTRPLLMLNARGKSLTDVLGSCKRAIKKHGVEMIVLDSISRASMGDLNENQSGNKVVDALSSLSPTWLALGHTSRASDEHLYGSIMQDAGADICVQLLAQIKQDGTLGIGYQITKQNDIGFYQQKIFSFRFNENILTEVRPAKPMEFPEIEGKSPQDMETTIIEFVSNADSGDATATEVANTFGYDRGNVSRLFISSGKFVQTRKVKQSTYYGVKV